MAFFIEQEPAADPQEAFFDALISYSSDDSFVPSAALKNSSLFAVIKLISERVSNVQLTADQPKLTKLLNDYSFKQSLLASALLFGNSFAYYDGKTLQLLPNSNVTVTLNSNGLNNKVTYKYTDDSNKTFILDPSKVLHLFFFSTNGISGISPVKALRDELNLTKQSNALASGFFTSPSTNILKVHKTGLNSQSKENIRTQFEKVNAGKLSTIVLDDSTDYSQAKLDTNVLKILSSTDFSSKAIASVYGLPESVVGIDAEHSALADEQQQLTYCLLAYARIFVNELESFFSQNIVFDDRFFNVSFADKAKSLVELMQNGVLNQTEVRSALGFSESKDPNKDQFIIQLNNTFLKDLNNTNTDNTDPNSKEDVKS